eukprot:TRINITY_DN14256_c0_g1_i1.p1 TRINITY_DN14256_c0_g1~~TRINITY_DN14256_c0_g1_i1.p1  ORF type:complete len:418 (+),score=45.14 TRINITY_DN14256_c0_g1_i1:106-1359(+)
MKQFMMPLRTTEQLRYPSVQRLWPTENSRTLVPCLARRSLGYRCRRIFLVASASMLVANASTGNSADDKLPPSGGDADNRVGAGAGCNGSGAKTCRRQRSIYWSMNFPHGVLRAQLDVDRPVPSQGPSLAGTEELLFGGKMGAMNYPHGLTVHAEADRLYWSEHDLHHVDTIRRSWLNGSGAEDFIIGPLAWGLVVDTENEKLYWTDINTAKIQRANLDGSHVEDVLTEGLDSPAGLALDVARGRLYWCDWGTRKVHRANIDGSEFTDLVVDLAYPQGIALDLLRGHVYWTDSGTFKIQRASLDGTGVVNISQASLKDPYAVAVDPAAGELFWASVGTVYEKRHAPSSSETNSKIQRSNLDGTEVEDLVSASRAKIFGLALVTVTGATFDSQAIGGSNFANDLLSCSTALGNAEKCQ